MGEVRDNSKFLVIGGVVVLLLIIAGAIFWLNSGEKVKEKPAEMENVEEGEEISEVISNGCEKLGLSFNTQQAYSCFDDTNNLVKLYVSRSSENVILKKIDFILSSSNDSTNYSSSFGLAPGAFYIYSIPFNFNNVQKIEVIATVQDGDGEKACESLFINYLQNCVAEEIISAEPEPEYYYDENLNVILFNVSNNTSNVTNGTSPSGISTTSIFSSKPQKKILNFSLDSIFGEIDEVRHRIFIKFPDNRSLNYLVPVISVSENATIIPLSGVGKDFSSPVTYVVKASDNSTQQYVVYASNYIEEVAEIPLQPEENESEINLTDINNETESDSGEDCPNCTYYFNDSEFDDTEFENETNLTGNVLPSPTLVNNLSGTVAGTWSANLSAASQIAQMNKKFYIINYGNLDSCDPCKSAEKYIFNTSEFKQWAYNNGIAMIYASDKYPTLEPTKTIKKRYIAPLQASGVSIKFPFILIVGYEDNQAVTSFVLRKGMNLNGIKVNMTPNNFISIVDSYTGKYRTNLTSVSSLSSSVPNATIPLLPININWTVPNVSGSTSYYSSIIGESFIGGAPTQITGAFAGKWTKDLVAAKALAKQTNKFIIVDFGSSAGCRLCTDLDYFVYEKNSFRQWASQNGIILVYADYVNQTSFYNIKKSIIPNYSSLSFPNIFLLDGNGNVFGNFLAASKQTYNNITLDPFGPEKYVAVVKSYLDLYALSLSSSGVVNPSSNSSGLVSNIYNYSSLINWTVSLNSDSSIYSKKPVVSQGSEIGQWTRDLEAAKALAKTNNRFYLVSVTASKGCGYCNDANTLIFNKADFTKWAIDNKVPLVYADTIKSSDSNYLYPEPIRTMRKLYLSGAVDLPTILVIDGSGNGTKLVGKFVLRDLSWGKGALTPQHFADKINSIVGNYTFSLISS